MQQKWNDHHELRDTHSFMSASQFHWLNYDDEKLIERYFNKYSQELGTVLHSLAEFLIRNRIKLNQQDNHLIKLWIKEHSYIPDAAYDVNIILPNLMAFVNDAISYHMDPEIVLYCDRDAYGTADAILMDTATKTLRIHDYKSGVSQTHIEQLLIYAAYACLEYNIKPEHFKTIELRIYQNGEVNCYNPLPEEIDVFINIIKHKIDIVSDVRKGVIR